jgi:polar amino acid transport system permease protein
VPDLMYQVSMITQQSMRPLPLYTGTALTYFAIVLIGGSSLRVLADRWRARIVA